MKLDVYYGTPFVSYSVLMVLHNFRGGTPSEPVLIVLHNHNFREGTSVHPVYHELSIVHFDIYYGTSFRTSYYIFRGGTPSEPVLIVLHNHNFREGYSTLTMNLDVYYGTQFRTSLMRSVLAVLHIFR